MTVNLWKRLKLLLATLLISLLMFTFLLLSQEHNFSVTQSNPLDGCVYVYLDMGTNIGVQIR